MLAFAALALLAAVTLSDGRTRGVTLALLALFAVRTWLHHRKEQQATSEDDPVEKY